MDQTWLIPRATLPTYPLHNFIIFLTHNFIIYLWIGIYRWPNSFCAISATHLDLFNDINL
jgi:hypothetical protein